MSQNPLGKTPQTASSASSKSDRWVLFGICFLLVAAVWAVFGQTRNFQFVNYDDDRCVYENAAVKGGLTSGSIEWAFTHTVNDNWLPLTTLSHMLDCRLYSITPRGPHLVNVAFHAVNSVLLFLLLRSLTGAFWRSAFVATVFAVHPLHVESVAWISERKDVLSAFFFLLTVWAYASYARGKPRAKLWYVASLILFAFGLMSKPMLVTLPFILLLLDYWPLARISVSANAKSFVQLIVEKTPFLILAAADCVATVLAQKSATVSIGHLGLTIRIANAVTAYATYLWQMIFPSRLAPFYYLPPEMPPAWIVGLSAIVLLAISVGVIVARRNCPWLLAGWLWYLGMLVPVIGFMQVGDQSHADRYTYLPQIGLYVIFAWGVFELVCRFKWPQAPVELAMAAILIALIFVARTQTSIWQDSVSLWKHSLEAAPENPFAHNNLGLALAVEGNAPDAIHEYERAIQMKPDYADAHNNLGLILATQGNLPEAIQHYQAAIRSEPDDAAAIYNLANIFAAQKKSAEAIQLYERAIQLQPDLSQAYYNSGNVFADVGRLPEAVERFERALQLDPNNADIHNNLGNALSREGKLPEAIQHFDRARQLRPNFIEAMSNLATALALQNKLTEAADLYQQALDIAVAQHNTTAQENIQRRLNACRAVLLQPQSPERMAR